jgi:hypothetical protein
MQPQSSLGLNSVKRWLNAQRKTVTEPPARQGGTFFSKELDAETFMRKTASSELTRITAREKLRASIEDAERWQTPPDAGSEAQTPKSPALEAGKPLQSIASTFAFNPSPTTEDR